MSKRRLIGACSLTMLVHSVAVAAPQAADPQDQAPAPRTEAADAPPAGQDADAGTAFADIVVTATRREERLQPIPVTVTAVSGDLLEARGIQQSTQLSEIVPGLTFTRSASVGLPVIRGVGSTGVSGGDESNVATYVDGVYQADPFSTIIDFVDVQRIEVLRGPQGTVFGRNATGGLINIITPDPSFDLSGKVSATFGRMRNGSNDMDVRGYVTGPLSDTVAAHVAAYYTTGGDHVTDLLRGGGFGGRETYSVRAKVLFEPSERASILLTGEYSRQKGEEVVFQPIDGKTRGRGYAGVILPLAPWQTSSETLPQNDYIRASVSLRTRFDLGFANLETTGAYIFSRATQLTDTDGTNIPLAYSAPDLRNRTYSQEVRLLSTSSGRFTWLAGIYAFHLSNESDIILANAINPPNGAFAIARIVPEARTTSFAGFVEGTLEAADDLFITLGNRFTYERRTFSSMLNGNLIIPASRRSYERDTYRAAIRYQITPETNIYGSYGTGFKSGVFNAVTTILNAVEPETIKAAELGVKSDISRSLRANLSVYRYIYSGLQVNSRAPSGAFVLQNAATAKAYGGELEVTAKPAANLTLTGSAAYSHARYDSFPGAQSYAELPSGANAPISVDASGNRLVRTPDWTFNLGSVWQKQVAEGTVTLNGNLFWSDRVFWDFSNAAGFSQRPYTLVSAGAAYQTSRGWRFEIAGTNLFNEVVATQIQVNAQATVRLLQRPRRVTATVSYAF